MVLQFRKNYKNKLFIFSIGFLGRIYPFGNLPKRYSQFEDNLNFIQEEWFLKDGIFSFLPICFYSTNRITVDWLFFHFTIFNFSNE